MVEVSIIMPAFNSESTVSESIDSVLSQSFSDFELIIIDDCSSDRTLDIIKNYEKMDARVKIISLEKNSGAGVARTAGINVSLGTYVAFLDSDDLWLQHKLQKQISFMIEHNHPFTCSFYNIIDEENNLLATRKPNLEISYADLLIENVIGCLTVVFDVRVFGRVGMPPIRKRQDYALWLTFLKNGDVCVCLPEVLALYRKRSNSISGNKFEMVIRNYQMFRHEMKFGFIRSAYCVLRNVLSKIVK